MPTPPAEASGAAGAVTRACSGAAGDRVNGDPRQASCSKSKQPQEKQQKHASLKPTICRRRLPSHAEEVHSSSLVRKIPLKGYQSRLQQQTRTRAP